MTRMRLGSSDSSSSSSSASASPPPVKQRKAEKSNAAAATAAPTAAKRKRSEDHGATPPAAKEDKRAKTDEDATPSRPRTRSMDVSLPKNAKPLTDFDMNDKTRAILTKRGIASLFEIQCLTYGPILAGFDVVGRARTGQGKTLAYLLPIIELLFQREHDFQRRGRPAAVLVMAPTRELAMQVASELQLTAPHFKVTSVYGGSSYEPQLRAMREGLDAVVGTPGRICDLIDKGALKLSEVQFLVLDEADQMLDMGFQDEMQKVFDALNKRPAAAARPLQTLLFSATMPKWVQSVASSKMRAPVTTVDLIGEHDVRASTDVDHMCLMAPVNIEQRAKLINDLLVVYGELAGDGRAIIFCATKKHCDELAASTSLQVEIRAMHGDVVQATRERTLAAFRRGQVKVLVATDVAARGLDIKGVDLVINNGPPATNMSRRADSESYVHRSGRTGRAGRKGRCITLFGPYDESMILDIERSTGNTLRRIVSPQPQDLMRGAAKAACEAVSAVPADVHAHFKSAAAKLAESMGAQDALQACLARLTGFDNAAAVRPRSLLQAVEGWMTLRFAPTSGKVMHSKGLVFNALREALSPEAADATRGMVLTDGGDAAYFDIDCKFEREVRELVAGSEEFSVPTEIPKLRANERAGDAFRGGRGGGRGGGFGAMSGRGSFRGRGAPMAGRGRGGIGR